MYPEGFWVAMDDVLLTYSDKRNYYKMQIVNTDVPERPLITAEVNPDAEGPFRADQSYATWDGEKNRLQITALPKTEDPDGFIVVYAGPVEIGGNTYRWNVRYFPGATDYEEIFKQILSTFEF